MFKSFFTIIIIHSLSNLGAMGQESIDYSDGFEIESREISFQSEPDKIKIAGTLTFPKTSRKGIPAVILISGSGPQNRDSEIVGQKPFLHLANHLSGKGIAVLRLDDRGVDGSEGDTNSSFSDIQNDVLSAKRFLSEQAYFDLGKVGLIGHSLGGLIIPLLGRNNPDVFDFSVLMAGPTLLGKDLMILQKEKIERLMGLDESQITSGSEKIAGAYDLMLEEKASLDQIQNSLKAYIYEAYKDQVPENQIPLILNQISAPWFIELIRYDPFHDLKSLPFPALALFGEHDVQVPATENMSRLSEAIKESSKIEMKLIQAHNHLFQLSKTGLPVEYSTLGQSFSEVTMQEVSSWILSIF